MVIDAWYRRAARKGLLLAIAWGCGWEFTADFGLAQEKIESDVSRMAEVSGGWAVEWFDEILNAPNPAARDHLLRAGFAAGPQIVPILEAALADDRTAEFAAQLLAFMGHDRALRILQKLVHDPRDLALKRFFYGALGEFNTPRSREALVNAVARADREPDPAVTEMAILALTVASYPPAIERLTKTLAGITDVVIREELESALEVMNLRAAYLERARQEAPDGFSVEQTVEGYFAPALEAAPLDSQIQLRTEDLTFSPNSSRVLARVRLVGPEGAATYDMVLQKRLGSWELASVWTVSLDERKRTFQPESEESDRRPR